MKKLIILSLLLVSNHLMAQKAVFNKDLSNAVFPEGVWTIKDGVMTASEDQAIWSSKIYENFELTLEFQTADGTNSGVVLYCNDIHDWIPNSIEIQIADDHSEQWGEGSKYSQCGAVFGHVAPLKSVVKKPGEWNTMKVVAIDRNVRVEVNGELISTMDMRKWTSAKINPDGSEIPSWLSIPAALLPDYGHIGFQGKHAGAPIFFRNIMIEEL
ncbi:DUF1080 domain-containing protein [Bacteroidota bacterium]